MTREPMTRTYRIAIGGLARPVVRWWGRLQVTGLELLPETGPVLIVANHDSQFDPIVIGSAALPRRQIRALAKSELWKVKWMSRVLDGMGQIPIERGRADVKALDAAVTALKEGACIGVFPEGTISRGRTTRAHSGAGRLVQAVPETVVVSCRVTGTVDVVRFPKRPRLRVEFFVPAGGQPQPEESALALMRRLTAEVRVGVPYALPGRKKTAAKLRAANEAEANAKASGTKTPETTTPKTTTPETTTPETTTPEPEVTANPAEPIA